jgi:hypothetical protein
VRDRLGGGLELSSSALISVCSIAIAAWQTSIEIWKEEVDGAQFRKLITTNPVSGSDTWAQSVRIECRKWWFLCRGEVHS